MGLPLLRAMPQFVGAQRGDQSLQSCIFCTLRANKVVVGRVAGVPVTPLIERLSAILADGQEDAGTVVANILMLLADSLQVGMTLVTRIEDDTWMIESAYDRAGIGLRSGDGLSYADILARVLSAGGMATLIAENVRDDAPLCATRLGAGVAHWGRYGNRAQLGARWDVRRSLHASSSSARRSQR